LLNEESRIWEKVVKDKYENSWCECILKKSSTR
jgi:hypothetical protein